MSKTEEGKNLILQIIEKVLEEINEDQIGVSQTFKLELFRKVFGLSSLQIVQETISKKENLISLMIKELNCKDRSITYLLTGTLSIYFFFKKKKKIKFKKKIKPKI